MATLRPAARDVPDADPRAPLSNRRRLAIHDPKVPREQIYEDLGKDCMDKIEIEDDVYIACTGAHALAIITEWDSFKELDYQRIYDTMQKPAFVFDGRNIVDTEALKKIGFQVWAVGKSGVPA